jgi:hypothetical protein
VAEVPSTELINLDPNIVVAESEGTRTPTSARARNRASTSDVWNDFDKIYKVIDGVRVRCQAKCKVCKRVLSAKSSGGTGHLNRHCMQTETWQNCLCQSLIQFNPNVSARLWEYNVDVAHSDMCHLICMLDLPICFAKSSKLTTIELQVNLCFCLMTTGILLKKSWSSLNYFMIQRVSYMVSTIQHLH